MIRMARAWGIEDRGAAGIGFDGKSIVGWASKQSQTFIIPVNAVGAIIIPFSTWGFSYRVQSTA